MAPPYRITKPSSRTLRLPSPPRTPQKPRTAVIPRITKSPPSSSTGTQSITGVGADKIATRLAELQLENVLKQEIIHQARFFYSPFCAPNTTFDVILSRSNHVLDEPVACLVTHAVTATNTKTGEQRFDDDDSVMGGDVEDTQVEYMRVDYSDWMVMADTLDKHHASYVEALEGLLREVRGENGEGRYKVSVGMNAKDMVRKMKQKRREDEEVNGRGEREKGKDYEEKEVGRRFDEPIWLG